MSIQFRRTVCQITFFALLLLIMWAVMPKAHAQLRSTNVVGLPGSTFTSAETCRNCHTKQYNEWRSSMMSYSSISPPIHALELTENHVDRGMFGRLARTPSAPVGTEHTENQLFCQKCHTPVAVFTDLFANVEQSGFSETNRGGFPDSHTLLRQIAGTDPLGTPPDNVIDDISSLETANAKTAMEGVTCTVCHRINGQEESNVFPRPTFETGVANSGYLIEHLTNFGLGTLRGPFLGNELSAPHGTELSQPELTGNDGLVRPYIQTGEFCGSCHDVRIPFEDAETGEPFRRVENLFTEWRDSPWNDPGSADNPREVLADAGPDGQPIKRITTCQDCHMSQFMLDPDAKPGLYAKGSIADGFPERPRISNHRFMGVDRFLVLDLPADPDNTTELDKFDTSALGRGEVGAGTFTDLNASHLDFGEDNNADLRKVLLQKAVDFKITSARVAEGVLAIKVKLKNVGAGHNIPAGLSQERQVWIELEVLDKEGNHVYTSGYLTPLEEPDELFKPRGSVRYQDSYCGANDGKHEYECDLDLFRAKLDNALRIEEGSFVEGDDPDLVNYQNGFRLEGKKVFSQFIGDTIDNSNSLPPFKRRTERYKVPVQDSGQPFTINARLRFRPLPHEFLNALKQDDDFQTSRVTKKVIERNHVIDMERDSCVTGNRGHRC